MDKPFLLAIDPGSSSGAWAWHSLDREAILIRNMPEGYQEIWNLVKSFAGIPVHVIMEDVGGSMPGNAAKSARTFAAHVGALEMAFTVMGWPVTKVRPQKWMADLFGELYPKAPKGSTAKEKADVKKARKAYIHGEMAKLYPNADITLRQADAVALLHWGREKCIDGKA